MRLKLSKFEHPNDALFFENGVVDWRALKHKRERQTNRTLKKKSCPTAG